MIVLEQDNKYFSSGIESKFSPEKQQLHCNVVGGPAHNMANFEMWCNGQKSGQTCSIHSPDGVAEVSAKKIDLLLVY